MRRMLVALAAQRLPITIRQAVFFFGQGRLSFSIDGALCSAPATTMTPTAAPIVAVKLFVFFLFSFWFFFSFFFYRRLQHMPAVRRDCERCTFSNAVGAVRCAMCDSPLPLVAAPVSGEFVDCRRLSIVVVD